MPILYFTDVRVMTFSICPTPEHVIVQRGSDDSTCLPCEVKNPNMSLVPPWSDRFDELKAWKYAHGDCRIPKAEGALGRYASEGRLLGIFFY